MRFWFRLPRIFGIRPGISFSPSDFADKKSSTRAGEKIEGSFVYVIRGDHNMVKIGVTTNPAARIAALRTGSAFPIGYAFLAATTGTGFDIEKEARSILAKYRCHGEWFDVTPELAMSAVTGAAARLGQPLQQVNEKTSDLILQIASGQLTAKEMEFSALDVFKIVALTLLYTLLGFFLMIVIIVMIGMFDTGHKFGSGASTTITVAVLLMPFFSFILASWKISSSSQVHQYRAHQEILDK